MGYSPRNYIATVLLTVFVGFLGIHRFYLGRTFSAVLYLFTLGLFGIGWMVDLFRVPFGWLSDAEGRPVSYRSLRRSP